MLAACSDAPEPVAPPPPPVDDASPDRQILVEFYNATGGPGWHQSRNWNSTSPIGSWYGVTTNYGGSVTELELDDNGLTGTLPARLADLPYLRRLVLDGNEISGPIPPELGSVSRLTMLSLRGNSLDGPIPPEIGALAELDTLDLFNTGVSGAIPPTLGNLASLQRLTLGWNRLSGPIPPEIGRLDNATYMNFSRNELSGTIPPELGDLDSIELLSVSRNNLTGTIPTELGSLATIERLYLYDNQLSGAIPPVLGRLSRLTLLWIHQNRLAGPIPAEFAGLTALADLRAYQNGLTGAIPSYLGGFPLRILYLNDNAFGGRIPPQIGSIGTLEYLNLSGNQGLAGLLPRSLLGVEHLQVLVFDDTGLCAHVDAEFQSWLRRVPTRSEVECDIGRVERFALAEFHELTGGESWTNRGAWGSDAEVGDWHGVASQGGRVVELALPGNGLVGPLPAQIANLGELRVVDLSDNELAGAVPDAIAGLAELTELRLGDNAGLAGALPFGLRRLERLRVLDFTGTGLCASPSADFQAWLAGIAHAEGAVCDNPEAITVSLETVYLTQSIQTPAGQVRLVAGRDALLRAFLTAQEPRGYFEPEVEAVFEVAGDELHRVVMTRDDNQIPAEADEGDLAQSYNAVIPAEVVAPGVQMAVQVDPDSTLPLTAESRTRFPVAGSAALDVVETSPMHLTVVPVLTPATTDSSFLAWAAGIDDDSPQVGLLRNAFPFAEFSASPRDVYITSLDVKTSAGQVALLGELEALRTSEGGNGYYYGVADMSGATAGGRGQLPGWVGMGQASANTLAHEVGHNVSLRHAPCGGPGGVDPAFPNGDGGIGYWGYDFRHGTTLSPDRSKDIMSYCRTSPWISAYHFGKVIDHRASLTGAPAVAGSWRGRSCGRHGCGGRSCGGPSRGGRSCRIGGCGIWSCGKPFRDRGAGGVGRGGGRRDLAGARVSDGRAAASPRRRRPLAHQGDRRRRADACGPGLHARRGRARRQALLLHGSDRARMGGLAGADRAGRTGGDGHGRARRRRRDLGGDRARVGAHSRHSAGIRRGGAARRAARGGRPGDENHAHPRRGGAAAEIAGDRGCGGESPWHSSGDASVLDHGSPAEHKPALRGRSAKPGLRAPPLARTLRTSRNARPPRSARTVLIRPFAFAATAAALAACPAADSAPDSASTDAAPSAAVRPGIEVLLADSLHLVSGRRVGLVTNHTGRGRDGTPSIDLLAGHSEVELVALFSPEHGIRGSAEAGERVASGIDERTGLPVHSLYGETRRPTDAMLDGIDVLLFDIQDVGARYYTYLSTMALSMEAAGERGIPFVVLDRPNPIGGDPAQGSVLRPGFASFVGLYPVPMRHGLTAGEFAQMAVGEFGVEVELAVAVADGWRRAMPYAETGIPWIAPSPNMPSVESALHYPGTCLFEGTPISVGRGTDRAFQQVGAPWLDGEELAARLEALGVPDARFAAVRFTPESPGDGKFGGVEVGGVRLEAAGDDYDPTLAALALLAETRALSGDQWSWRIAHFDRLAGTDSLRLAVEAGASYAELADGWGAGLEDYLAMREPYLLYEREAGR